MIKYSATLFSFHNLYLGYSPAQILKAGLLLGADRMSTVSYWARKESIWRIGPFLKPEDSSQVMSQGKPNGVQNIRGIFLGENNVYPGAGEPRKRINSWSIRGFM